MVVWRILARVSLAEFLTATLEPLVLSYVNETIKVESEETSFSTVGKVRTADGREIDFNAFALKPPLPVLERGGLAGSRLRLLRACPPASLGIRRPSAQGSVQACQAPLHLQYGKPSYGDRRGMIISGRRQESREHVDILSTGKQFGRLRRVQIRYGHHGWYLCRERISLSKCHFFIHEELRSVRRVQHRELDLAVGSQDKLALGVLRGDRD